MKRFLRLGDSYAHKATPDNKHKPKHIGRAPLGLRSSSARSPLRLDTRSAPGPYLMRTCSAISSLVLRCSSACSSVLLRCFSAAPPLLERRTNGKQAGNGRKTNVSTTPQVSGGYYVGNGNQRSMNGAEAEKAGRWVRDGSLKTPYTLAVCRGAARDFGLETPLASSNDMTGIPQHNPKGKRSFPDTGTPVVEAHGMPCSSPPSIALPSLPIRMCPAYVSLKRPKGGTLAKVWRINSGRKGHGEDIGYDNDFSCVQTPAKAPALPGLGLAMGVFFLLLCLHAYTQESLTITGTVISATSSQPIEGATITNKRTRIHAITDRLGEYRIPARPDDVLTYSFVGYLATEEEVNRREVISVALDSTESMLEEVEVDVGYYQVKKTERTGSIAKIEGATISQQPVNDLLLALTGRLSGVVVSQNSGITGAGVNVQIRGRNSIDQGNDPLYIVDGVPFSAQGGSQLASAQGGLGNSPFSILNPEDIESVVVAKDADATAIYGSRGANGVILITTKRGRAGKTKVSLNVNSGVSRVTRFMELLNTGQYVGMRKEAFKNDGRELTPATAYDILVWDTTRYTDLVKELIGGAAKNTNASVSLSGGSENTSFLISSGLHRQTTVFPTDMAYTRASLAWNINHHSGDKRFHVLASANYGNDDNRLPSSDITSAVRRPPNLPNLHDDYGELNWNHNGYSFDNPLGALRRRYTLKTENLIGNLRATYKLMKDIDVALNLGYSSQKSNEIRTNPIAAYDPVLNRTGNANHGHNLNTGVIIEPQINYGFHTLWGAFEMLLGGAWQQNVSTGLTVDATGYADDVLLESIGGASVVASRNSFAQYRYAAVFGRANYNHLGKYVLNLTARRDGSSRFGPGRRFATFGALGGAWFFSKEPFMEKLPFVSSGKVRSSYGITGSDAIGNYQYLDTYNFTTNPYGGQPAMYPTRLFNADFGWEANRKFELALEMGFKQDGILLSAAYYNNQSSNQLVQYNLPGQTGFLSVTRNMPAIIQNSGLEIELEVSLVRLGSFSWNTSLNLTFPKSTLLEFPNLETSAYRNRYVMGKSLNLGNGFRLNGVNPETGTYEYLDVNGQITANPARDRDLVVDLVNLDPKVFGGFLNSFTFSNVHVELFLEFRKQVGYSYLRDFTQAPGTMFNQPTVVLDRWQQPGSETHIQRFTALASSEASRVNALMNANGADAKYTDASYARLKNLAITYRLPMALSKQLRVGACSIYLQGQNLFTFTNYLGNDPETQSNLRLPPLKTLSAGIKLDI